MALPFTTHRKDHKGVVPLHRGAKPLTQSTEAEQRRKRRDFSNHIIQVGKLLNKGMKRHEIGVKFDYASYTKAINSGSHDNTVNVFNANEAHGITNGFFHDTQIETTAEVLATINENPGKSGTILGAMQFGKTTTGVSMLLSGPIFRLLSGGAVNYYPVLMSTSHRNVALQTRISISNFMLYYGNIPIVARDSGDKETTTEYHRRADTEITLANYEHNLLGRRMPDLYVDQSKDESESRAARRVCGKNIVNLHQKFYEVEAGGYCFCLITDEPQFGAATGSVTEKIYDYNGLIDQLADDDNYHMFIGLSATPFEFSDLERLWTVRCKLPKSYHGYNYWNGEKLDPDSECTQPQHFSFTTVEKEFGVSDFSWMDLAMYNPRTPEAFKRKMNERGYEMEHEDYKDMFETGLNDLLTYIDKQHSGEGICIRLWNDNKLTPDFIDLMEERFSLRKRFNVIIYAADIAGEEISTLVRQAKAEHPKETALVVVTGGARMGVAFPSNIRWFIEFTSQSNDLNSLLQGLVGRACGHHKESKIILTDKNAAILDNYTSTLGSHGIHRTSRHSKTVYANGSKPKSRRGRRKNILRLYECYRHLGDPVVAKFMEQLSDMCSGHLDNNESNTKKAFIPADYEPSDMGRRGLPIWKILDSLGVDFYEYLNRPEVKAVALPEISATDYLDFVKPGQNYKHSKRDGSTVTKKYRRKKGFAGVSIADFSKWALESGITNLNDLNDPDTVRNMACNIKTMTDRTHDGDHGDSDLFFMLNMVRARKDTGEIMAPNARGSFEWKFFMITFQLHNSYKSNVDHTMVDSKTLPHHRSWPIRFGTENEKEEVMR